MLVQFAREAKDSVRIRSLIETATPVFETALAERRYVTAMALVEAYQEDKVGEYCGRQMKCGQWPIVRTVRC